MRIRRNNKQVAELYTVTYEQGGEQYTACSDVEYSRAFTWYNSLRDLPKAHNLVMTSRKVTTTFTKSEVVQASSRENR